MSLQINNLIGFGVAAGGGGAQVLEFVELTEGDGNSSGALYPSDLAAGDLLYFLGFADDVGSTRFTPSGWTLIDTDQDAGDEHVSLYRKEATGSETGRVEDNGAAGNPSNYRCAMISFRGGPTSFVADQDTNAEWTADTPANQIKNVSTIGVAPMLVLAAYAASSAVTTRTFSGETPDGEQGRADGRIYFKWLFVTGSASDITVGKSDDGRDGLISLIQELA